MAVEKGATVRHKKEPVPAREGKSPDTADPADRPGEETSGGTKTPPPLHTYHTEKGMARSESWRNHGRSRVPDGPVSDQTGRSLPDGVVGSIEPS